jgi:hypothetical protein
VVDATGNRPDVLADELSHVVQQDRVRGIPMSGLPIGEAHDPAETAGVTSPAGSVPVLRRQLARDTGRPFGGGMGAVRGSS